MYIPKWAEKKLSKDSLLKIEESIKLAEHKTQAEIVPMLVKSSSDGNIKELLLLFLILAFSIFFVPLWSLIIIGVCYYILSKKIQGYKKVDARKRALLEFYESDIKKTIGGTGVLLFISLSERVIEVVVDKAIAEKVEKDHWDEVRDAFVLGMKKSGLEEAFCSSINILGKKLEVISPAQKENIDELHNHLIIKE